MKRLHLFFSKFGLSLGGHEACLKHGCERYCGYSPSEHSAFNHRKTGYLLAEGFRKGLEEGSGRKDE